MPAALIGDLVKSREQPDRRAAQRALRSALHEVNQLLRPAQPLATTVGDEFQGVFTTPAAAVTASILVRLHLREVIDSRYGIGWGDLEVFEQAQPVASQDGPAWWAARDAIIEVKRQAEGQPRFKDLRTWFLAGDAADRALEGFVNAFLMNRDALVGELPERGRRLLLGLLMGRTQRTLAQDEGISESAVSQYLTRHALLVAVESHRLILGDDA